MSIFNSQKINSDPKSWRSKASGFRYAQFPGGRWPEHYTHDPRPEFDNNASAALEAFRDDCESQARVLTVKRCAELWLKHGISARVKRATWGEILHAQKVLRRLAALA